MARLFGTDGIRGVANVELKPTLAYALGRATARRLVGTGGALVVGQDTRRSGDMFVSAVSAGAASLGADVHEIGVVPTPALAFIAGSGRFAAGIMVSASHNPADDNGLKVLDGDGLKLDDSVEDELEQLIWRSDDLGGATNAGLGQIVVNPGLVDDYRRHRLALAGSVRATGTHLVLDGANGSGATLGAEILRASGATVEVIHAEPDGVNINLGCGATDPASLAEAVVARGADVGFALDGDADRLIAIDAAGQVVDGDHVLGILALDRLGRGALPGGVVVSILSNGGLQSAVEAAGGQVVRTPVGDKYILEGMQVSGARLGGEKSGHVIDLDHTTTGDGIVTAMEVLRVMTSSGRSLAALAADIPMLPQQQRAVEARHKDQWEADRILQAAIAEAAARLGPAGRVIVRPSGTEPALRVMVEGPDADLVTELADSLARVAGERLN
jgi:phosphoglucosamine mutase